MTKVLQNDWETLKRLHRNENGAEAGLERILLVAFIALPLLGLLIYYKGKVVDFMKSIWSGTTNDSAPTPLNNGG